MAESRLDELIAFVNRLDPRKYGLIKVALAHHRFGWIHPFFNGNGRVVRLLTYALLIKYGFNVKAGGRVLNPTAVFCNNRERYYEMLSEADNGTDEGLESWCVHVLEGITEELKKVDQLADFDCLKERILIPALRYAQDRELITERERKVLQIAAQKGVVKAKDIAKAMPGLSPAQRTYQIRKLVGADMLPPIKSGARQYIFGFSNNNLIRGGTQALTEEGFISAALSQPQ